MKEEENNKKFFDDMMNFLSKEMKKKEQEEEEKLSPEEKQKKAFKRGIFKTGFVGPNNLKDGKTKTEKKCSNPLTPNLLR